MQKHLAMATKGSQLCQVLRQTLLKKKRNINIVLKNIVGPFSKYFIILVACSQRLIHTKTQVHWRATDKLLYLTGKIGQLGLLSLAKETRSINEGSINVLEGSIREREKENMMLKDNASTTILDIRTKN